MIDCFIIVIADSQMKVRLTFAGFLLSFIQIYGYIVLSSYYKVQAFVLPRVITSPSLTLQGTRNLITVKICQHSNLPVQ